MNERAPVLARLQSLSAQLNRALAWAAGIALIAMMLFTVADMALRSLGRPVAGSFEVIGWLSATAMALALGYTQLHRGHVAIDLVTTRLPPRPRALVEVLVGLAGLLLLAAVARYLVGHARELQLTGSRSETLKVVVYPWVYVASAGAAGMALALAVDLLAALQRLRGARRGATPGQNAP